MPKIIFIIGMHRSGTSALSGSTQILGADHMPDLIKGDTANAKGYFEPASVVRMNTDLLGELGRSWNDCRPMSEPDGAVLDKYERRATNIINKAKPKSDTLVIKDPRISMLPVFWAKCAKAAGFEPCFLIAIRTPIGASASVVRRDGLEERAAFAIWNRYMLEAEKGSRGYTRSFVEIEKLIGDPIATLERAQTQLGISWPDQPTAMRAKLEAFLESGLLKKKSANPGKNAQLALEVFDLLSHLETDTPDDVVLDKLDAIAAGFNPTCHAIHERMAAAQLRLAIERKWQIEQRAKKRAASQKDEHVATRAVLRTAAKLVAPVSPRTARRFRNSADKREPLGTDAPESARAVAPQYAQDGDLFVPFDPPPKATTKVRAIAHYLPQFHAIPENDLWWGKGFTEWSNVGKALPNYQDHYQPHCPIHFGYYDLANPRTMVEQAQVAKAYGLGGFSHYFYWFAGKTLLETPLQQMLDNPDVDIPFCLTWANENWTRTWDGGNHHILIGQEHSIGDSVNLLRHLRRYFEDPRYIRIDDKPVFTIYNSKIIPDLADIIDAWREEAASWGMPGLYLIGAETHDITPVGSLGFDAAMQFPPHNTHQANITDDKKLQNPKFTGEVFDYEKLVAHELAREEPHYKFFRSSMLSWDNTARRQDAGRIYDNFSIDAYSRWTSHISNAVLANDKYSPDEKIIFINAWNEWAEGTHLEPDRRYGFAYLKATYDSLPNAD